MKLSSHIYQAFHHALLIDFLTSRFTYLSKEQWADRINEHKILVNEKPAVPDTELKNGDFVSYDIEDIPEPEADLSYDILYEDEWIVGVNKPGNLLVHKAGASITRNLVFLLRHASKNPAWANIHSVNRLDRETSGIVLFSKHADCLKRLHRDFASGKIEKQYIAVVHNPPQETPMRLDLPIGQDLASSIHYKFCIDKTNGKDAVTLVETIGVSGDYALLRLRPLTGRTHQIRVHLAAIGSPVFGDKLYGLSEEKYLEWRSDPARFAVSLEYKRQALHCSRMTFYHPHSGEKTTIDAPLPDDMRQLIAILNLPGIS
jgi:RluA family pseudouridine synthase